MRMIKASSNTSEIVIPAGDSQSVNWISASDDVSADESSPKHFDMVAYTGGTLALGNFRDPVVVDLSGVGISAKSRPILRDHDSGRVVGHTEQIQNDGIQLLVSGVISAGNSHSEEVVKSSANGFPWQASVGMSVQSMSRVKAGDSVRVNGREFAGPVMVARKTTLKEVSFVALGGDDNTTASVAASFLSGEKDMGFEAWLQANGFDPDSLSEKQAEVLRASYEASIEDDGPDPVSDGPVIDSDADTNQAVQAMRTGIATEASRIGRIGEICAKYNSPTVKIGDDSVNLQAHAIQEGWTGEKTELEALRASRASVAPNGSGTKRTDTVDANAIEAALVLSVGGMTEEQAGKTYGEEAVNKAVSAEYRSYTIHALMGSVIRAAGRNYHGSFKSDAFIKAAFESDREIQAAGTGFSSISLSNILENVAHKSLIASYDAVNTTYQRLTKTQNMTDFKVHSRYRLDSTGAFKQVGPDGELKHVGLSDQKYTNQLDTYGLIIALTRQMMINDDLDAFLQLPRMIGRMSGLRIEEAFYAFLLSNPGTFFSVGNKNLQTGAGTALSITSLTSGKQLFLDQVDSNGKPILTVPQILLTPTTLQVDGEVLLKETSIIDGTSTTRQPARNPHAGTLEQITSPYLNNTSITDQNGDALTGQSSTAWYLFASPADRAGFCVGFLNGQRNPTLQSAETNFATLGMQWRAYHDFGVGAEDTTAVAKSAGA